ncbi:MAG TPA: FtsQ-type POTRA domain-containing protein [Candidatus Avacidaminococcus intestinavium]|uniref:FtsQ-type POTRA domain-containing protein n=1 Tax=Candidatus Avacidaminococcus intestinavium TaxID=2840684 RepID=A0A9D1SKZ9_9FIRM|nr:FtsQ-type POTRA domain-containing protein [Candidatus Avacidaminococcus intestinavium]
MVSTRQRLSKERQKRRLRLLKITLFFFFFLGLFIGFYQLIHQPWFSFGKVDVKGIHVIEKAEVMTNAGLTEPINLFMINRTQVKRNLMQDYRIKDVSTGYDWPNILTINIRERTAGFYIKTAYGGFVQVDFDGYVLKVGRGLKDAVVPYVSGINVGNVYLGDKIEQKEIFNLIQFLSKLDKDLLEEIAEIAVDGQKHVTIRMLTGMLIIIGELDDIENKTENFLTICNEIKTKNINAEYIDLTFSKPYIKVKR